LRNGKRRKMRKRNKNGERRRGKEE